MYVMYGMYVMRLDLSVILVLGRVFDSSGFWTGLVYVGMEIWLSWRN